MPVTIAPKHLFLMGSSTISVMVNDLLREYFS
jgi:hypothetical protein